MHFLLATVRPKTKHNFVLSVPAMCTFSALSVWQEQPPVRDNNKNKEYKKYKKKAEQKYNTKIVCALLLLLIKFHAAITKVEGNSTKALQLPNMLC